MAKIVACALLIYLSLICNILNANEQHDNDIKDTNTRSTYQSPKPSGFAYLAEHFDNRERFDTAWVLSEAKKDHIDEDIAKYDGIWTIEEPKRPIQDGDLGLVLKSKARHAAISTLLNTPFHFIDKPLIVQYEVNFQDGQECGGAYLKLLTLDPKNKESNLKNFHDKTPYTIMFGPDKCGNDHKLHFIFCHKNPLNDIVEEKHSKKPKERLEDFFKDKQPHLYTLIVRPNNTFEIKVDNKIVNTGSLLDDFTPPVNPPLEIEDPNDKQPDDWDDREKISDPSAVKPDDWDEDAPAQIVDEEDVMPEGWLEDEPPMIPNTDSVKPEDWDNDMDGEWAPPKIPNPKCANAPGCGPYKQKMKKNPRYKGKWLPPLINNPNYSGKWKPKLIHNPDYFNDEHPFLMSSIYAIGFELWSMSSDIIFDNILITDDEEVARKWSDETFEVRRVKIAEESETFWGRMMRSMNYKPGWWALYFCYCMVPITIYVWYLIKRSREEKNDGKEEEKQTLDINKELLNNEEEEEEEEAQQEATTEENKEIENTSETEEIIESKMDKSSGEDGPRRRKPNKE
ncbi:calnexin-like isoform X1 [Polistes fuscatus]|uniref:calnexin-like isoform X1 n=1 Tax=Polistes fuscatus TaxID=30207 RepID=UPI001CA89BD7|nr:calnexin-like isoform X1 [Polistes fuscatus]XP_043493414.1 calnexin-like isoform X1 [Polistes fuscatus]XP_043493415.1 calnexin-like isoform X1 [Polistes fuscatus]